jgi:uncharacterized protein (DUF2062 family)
MIGSFFKKRLINPLAGFLLQGISPSKLAWAVALGLVIAVFPVFGSTTLLCALAALLFRLNMPAIQLVNYFAYPLQFALFLPFIRFGEVLFGAPPMPFSVPQIFTMFREDVLHAIAVLWTSTWHAMVAWLLVAPFAALLIKLLLVPVFKRLLARLPVQPRP